MAASKYFIKLIIKNTSASGDDIETIRGIFIMYGKIIEKFDIRKTQQDSNFNYYVVKLYTTIDKKEFKKWAEKHIKYLTTDYRIM